ncbi:UvrD-helicase domain-containing protein [Blochmannia endosymbiont of Camponotus modoc]|uniref:UvrD-helicase domain-containing protein n=1 Tax=Blochmannia endosymbiont of Camponotus modoc TaxID=2945587 RepID=UPI0024E19163|nr:UvrD-helicase domain-containing protein [Blochmannia endosymbiont of Camponotus modoc]
MFKKSDLWISTFHGLANRLLCVHYVDANLPKNFQIFDNNDQIQLLQQLIRSLNLNENKYSVYKLCIISIVRKIRFQIFQI